MSECHYGCGCGSRWGDTPCLTFFGDCWCGFCVLHVSMRKRQSSFVDARVGKGGDGRGAPQFVVYQEVVRGTNRDFMYVTERGGVCTACWLLLLLLWLLAA